MRALPPQLDLAGQRFGRLLVLGYKHTPKGLRWESKCECGAVVAHKANMLTSGNTRSCGCLRREEARALFTTHGMKRTTEYTIWSGIIHRCENPHYAGYANYGGRGIVMCERWRKSFEAFYADMGPRPSKGHSIDRIDNDGNYEPGNCRWATRAEQARNKRGVHLLTFNGKTMPLSDWAAEIGMRPQALTHRIVRGWTVEKALTTPLAGGAA